MKERVSYDRVRAVFWVARIVAPRPRKKKRRRRRRREEGKEENNEGTSGIRNESFRRGRASEEKVNSLCPPREKEEDDL